MYQFDLIGDLLIRPQPIQQRNRRKSVQDEKDRLRSALKELTSKPPKELASASVQETRRWLEAQSKCSKLLKSERATVPQLNAAVNLMNSYQVVKMQ